VGQNFSYKHVVTLKCSWWSNAS